MNLYGGLKEKEMDSPNSSRRDLFEPKATHPPNTAILFIVGQTVRGYLSGRHFIDFNFCKSKRCGIDVNLSYFPSITFFTMSTTLPLWLVLGACPDLSL